MSTTYRQMPGNNRISDNLMLISLGHEEVKGILPYLDLVPLNIGERLADGGEEMKRVYFPISG